MILAAMAVSLLTHAASAAVIDGVDWAFNWQGDRLPQDAPALPWDPDWNVAGTPSLNGTGTATVLNPANYAALAAGQWFGGGANEGPASTLEFRVKLLTTGSSEAWGTALGIGWNGVQFQFGLGQNSAELTNNNGAGGGGSITLDTSLYHTYRIVFDSGEASLYIDDAFSGIANVGSGGFANNFFIGRFTGDVDALGSSEWEYIRWTNDGAFIPVPEPTCFLFLAVGGILIHRRFKKRG